MKKKKPIHNLHTLEQEIDRLQLDAKNKESRLTDNFEYLQQNFLSLVMKSSCCKKKNREDENPGFFSSTLKNEKFDAFLNKIADRFSDRAADGIDHLFGKIFHSKK